MEKYNEIIGLNDYFQAAYDLTNEIGDYWKQFIPNSKFFEAIRGVLNSLESEKESEKKSLWLQGTYGTGKSHALKKSRFGFRELTEPVKAMPPLLSNIFCLKIRIRLKNLSKTFKTSKLKPNC